MINSAKIAGWVTLSILIITGVFSMFTYIAPASAVTELRAEHSTFVTASQFDEYVLSDKYDSYYDFLDRLYQYEERGNEDMVRQIKRQLARLRSDICESDPMWEECVGWNTD